MIKTSKLLGAGIPSTGVKSVLAQSGEFKIVKVDYGRYAYGAVYTIYQNDTKVMACAGPENFLAVLRSFKAMIPQAAAVCREDIKVNKAPHSY